MKRTPKSAERCYQRLGERIRHLRQIARMTQETLAQKVGLTRTSIVNIENGRQRVMLHDIVTFATIFKLTPDRFIASLFTCD